MLVWIIRSRNLNLDIYVLLTSIVNKGLSTIMTCFKACTSLFIFVFVIAINQTALAQEDAVVAIVNDTKIMRSEVEDARMRLRRRITSV